ncbi:MAG: hypothetical protein WB729_06460 [Candidatus Sulfotelmatobacter sp.]
MSVSAVRNLLCWIMCALFPLSLFAADSGAAMLRSKGGVWVNGKENPDSTAIFSGDVIETKSGSVANVDVQGSSVLVQSESVVEWGDNELTLDHGSVSVGTSTELRVKINCVTVVPIANEWTQYDVTDVDGTVHVSANKLDVKITQGRAGQKPSDDKDSNSATVREGEKGSRDVSVLCAAAKPPGTAGGNPLSTTRWAEIGGGAGGAILLCVLLCHSGSSPKVSPTDP